jgi:hypothetical protein
MTPVSVGYGEAAPQVMSPVKVHHSCLGDFVSHPNDPDQLTGPARLTSALGRP